MKVLQLEDLIEQTGGCGRYQILLCLTVHSMKCIVCFSLLFMAFGAARPNWWCVDDLDISNVTLTTDMPQYKSCTAFNSTSKCSKFVFDKSMETVATQWDLICDKEWVTTTITSIQMAGTFIGNLACGQIADLIGRKAPLFSSVFVLVILNVATAFSTSWQMFAVFRFFIGLAIGFELTVQYNIMAEFTTARWRTWVVAVPSWAIETIIFSFAAWLLKDWRYIHFTGAATGLPLLATYWFVPESFRFYVGHDRFGDAENIIKTIARFNKRPVPDMSGLHALKTSKEEQKLLDKKYSFIDIIRNKELLKCTLLLAVVWITIGFNTYGIQFGVPKLSGNLFVNLFIPSLIGSPIQFIIIYLENRFGRKSTSILMYLICAVSALMVAIANRFEETSSRNTLINVTALLALTAINCSWSPVQTLTIENYPTVVRNLGFGLHNTISRIGAIIGPQLVFLDTKVSGIMYWICSAAALISIVCILPMRETNGIDLEDKIHERSNGVDSNEESVKKIFEEEEEMLNAM
ncbi:organic cation transporter protein-like [Ruditapes philippinarum]|uniref:organic cation transporter protein-like n=1 Tax=Ruditapes philippinarum TaxID=129788 RepID=UPI00295BD3CF|nr:organic cation transporter protein-like [Ruditapes philippinarum]